MFANVAVQKLEKLIALKASVAPAVSLAPAQAASTQLMKSSLCPTFAARAPLAQQLPNGADRIVDDRCSHVAVLSPRGAHSYLAEESSRRIR